MIPYNFREPTPEENVRETSNFIIHSDFFGIQKLLFLAM